MDCCIKCGAEKNKENFHLRKDGGFAHCKYCRKVYRIKNRLHRLLWFINARCDGNTPRNYVEKGIKNFLTLEDLQQLWDRDNADNLKEPSIDRINNNGNYEFDNCRFIEKIENSVKDKRKAVVQLNKNNDVIIIHISVVEAAKSIGVSVPLMNMILNGKRRNTTDFNWEFERKAA